MAQLEYFRWDELLAHLVLDLFDQSLGQVRPVYLSGAFWQF
jgi:hypothetical protein